MCLFEPFPSHTCSQKRTSCDSTAAAFSRSHLEGAECASQPEEQKAQEMWPCVGRLQPVNLDREVTQRGGVLYFSALYPFSSAVAINRSCRTSKAGFSQQQAAVRSLSTGSEHTLCVCVFMCVRAYVSAKKTYC